MSGRATVHGLAALGLAVTAVLVASCVASAAAVERDLPGETAVLGAPRGTTPAGEPADASKPAVRVEGLSPKDPTMGTNHVEVNLPRAPGLPACTYADVLTRPWTPATGDRALVDTELRLPRAYAPSDLVSVTRAGLTGRGQVRRSAINDLTAMARAARAAGARLAVQSAYRSYATQVATFNHWVSVDGYSRARRASARPGHSEHQLGTAIDFKSYGGGAPWSSSDWGRTKAGTWLRTNAWEYGFVMSYPKGKRSLTCYTYEPWHFRYVGRAVAKSIHDSGATLREWLWAQGEESSR